MMQVAVPMSALVAGKAALRDIVRALPRQFQ